MPCQVDPRGATYVDNPTLVAPRPPLDPGRGRQKDPGYSGLYTVGSEPSGWFPGASCSVRARPADWCLNLDPPVRCR